jgi:hypothetical protein
MSLENEAVTRQPKKDTRKRLRPFAVLARNTTWKCGKVERQVVDYLRAQFTRFGHVKMPIREMLMHFKLTGKKKNEFLDAIKRLEKRRIITITRQ